MCGLCEKVISVWKMMMQYNKRFTNQVNLFLLEMQKPSLLRKALTNLGRLKKIGLCISY